MFKTMLVTLGLVLLASIGISAARYLSFEKLVATAGTRVALSATALYSSHTIVQAKPTNTGNIFVGGADVASTNGYYLTAGKEVLLGDLMRKDSNEAIDLSKVYIDSSVNGEGVRVLYVLNRYKGFEPGNQ